MTNRRKDAGFTLVELMVVIVILGLLITIVALNVLPAQDRAMVDKAKADIATLALDVIKFEDDRIAFATVHAGMLG